MEDIVSIFLLGCFTLTSAQQSGSKAGRVTTYTADMRVHANRHQVKIQTVGEHKLLVCGDVVEVRRGDLSFNEDGETVVETTAASITRLAKFTTAIRSFQPAQETFTACVVLGQITAAEVSAAVREGEDVTCWWTIQQAEPALAVHIYFKAAADAAGEQLRQFPVGTKVRVLGRILRIARFQVDMLLDRIQSLPEPRYIKNLRKGAGSSIPRPLLADEAGTPVKRNQAVASGSPTSHPHRNKPSEQASSRVQTKAADSSARKREATVPVGKLGPTSGPRHAPVAASPTPRARAAAPQQAPRSQPGGGSSPQPKPKKRRRSLRPDEITDVKEDSLYVDASEHLTEGREPEEDDQSGYDDSWATFQKQGLGEQQYPTTDDQSSEDEQLDSRNQRAPLKRENATWSGR